MVSDAFLDLIAALGGPESAFGFFVDRFSLVVEETAPGLALATGFFADVFFGFVAVALSILTLSVFSFTAVASPDRVGHSLLLHSDTAGWFLYFFSTK